MRSWRPRVPGRPIRPLDHRVRMLRAVRFIDEVVVCDTPDATGSILKVCPQWFIQGIDYARAAQRLGSARHVRT
jgi:glycerol-3-phosphate cytidylyltransferase-like family protein